MRSFQPKNKYTKEQTTSLKPLDVDIRMVFSMASPDSSGGVILEQKPHEWQQQQLQNKKDFFQLEPTRTNTREIFACCKFN